MKASSIGGSDGTPSGVICMWSGAIVDIPSGWVLCDGSNGTPDLQDRMVVGAGSTYSVDDTGGETEHTLTEAEMPEHYHSLNVYSGTSPATRAAAQFGSTLAGSVNTGVTGSGDPHNNMPPYYALAFIMKL